jgi:hypothetical protein
MVREQLQEDGMRIGVGIVMTVGTLLVTVANGAAAGVVPEKASELVTLVSVSDDGTSCQGFPRLRRRLLADGTYADFAIPPKHVLVVTAVGVEGQGFTPNRRQPIRLLQTPALFQKVVIYDQVDALGFVGVYQVVAPVVVTSGTSLCLEAFNGLTTATVYGHLEKDK